ncbi:protease complex subunit PrcB family protein [Flavobacterium soli]|uniref:protease complex subunit PrcB family protein n=1 Tax=Flavobacterium soli TaxID=344881 RepID=UPI000405F27D|nr:protease complex subunit PrcB family protein [Flavobacterium soli]
MKKLLLVPIIAIIVSCNCKKTTVTEENKKHKEPLFEVLSESAYQGRDNETFEIIKDNASLKELYKSINNENVPTIDFTNNRVIALFLGQRSSGGHAIKVKNITEKENKIFVDIERIAPKPGENATMAMTNPYSIVKINSNKEIVINK